MYTLSEENYLKAIYRLSDDGVKASTSAIAAMLENNPASVVDMLKKMKKKGLIDYDKKSGAELTTKGNKTALIVIRKHRLWEFFLHEKLRYSWDEIHEIAEQLEHIQHPDLADRLDKFLGFPKYDPHGDPIPQADGKMAKTSKITLSELSIGKTSHVVGVKDSSVPFLQYLQKLDVGIGTKITLIETIPYDSSLVVKIEKRPQTTVSRRFAENIYVQE
jgi:DtxR family Mn-dependent transcriptional regulator